MKEPLLYKVVRPLIASWFFPTYRPIIINKNVIPKKTRVILAGNHTDNLDCFILGASTKRCVRFIAKDELIKGKVKAFFEGVGIVPFNRRIKDNTVVKTAVELLSNEAVIGIFPEGTVNRTEDIIMPFKFGAVKMALESKSPIIPFAIIGNYTKFKKNVKIVFGQLYNPETNDLLKETKILEDKVIKLMIENGE